MAHLRIFDADAAIFGNPFAQCDCACLTDLNVLLLDLLSSGQTALHGWLLTCAGYLAYPFQKSDNDGFTNYFSFAFTHQMSSDTVFFMTVYFLILERVCYLPKFGPN
jgi:hypothetical protein